MAYMKQSQDDKEQRKYINSVKSRVSIWNIAQFIIGYSADDNEM